MKRKFLLLGFVLALSWSAGSVEAQERNTVYFFTGEMQTEDDTQFAEHIRTEFGLEVMFIKETEPETFPTNLDQAAFLYFSGSISDTATTNPTGPLRANPTFRSYADRPVPMIISRNELAFDFRLGITSGSNGEAFDMEIRDDQHPLVMEVLAELGFVVGDFVELTSGVGTFGNVGNIAPGLNILGVGGTSGDVNFAVVDRLDQLSGGFLSPGVRVFTWLQGEGLFLDRTPEAEALINAIIQFAIDNPPAPTEAGRFVAMREAEPDGLLPGETATVNIELTNPGNEAVSGIIEEELTPGWEVTDITEGGALSNHVITWDITLEATSLRTLSYKVTAPASGDPFFVKFSGTVAGDPLLGVPSVRITQGGQDQVFQEQEGLVVIEAENFFTNFISTDFPEFEWVTQESGQIQNTGAPLGQSGTDFSGELMFANPLPRPPAGILQDVTISAELSYLININNPGTYYLWARELNANGGGSNTTFTNFDVRLGPLETRLGSGDTTWTWDNGKDDSRVSFNLTSGLHRYFIWIGETGFALDRFLLTMDPTLVPADGEGGPFGPEESPTSVAVRNWSLY